MRKILITLLIIIVTMSILWFFAGRQISSLVDQFRTTEVRLESLHSITYEGTGDGGVLIIENHRLSLAPLNPHVGSTKDNQLALAHAGQVFAFGPLHSSDKETLAADVPSDDTAALSERGGYIDWFSFKKGGTAPHYFELIWTKNNGKKLRMLWSADNDWNRTGLIRINISNSAR
jgi:hypothetical protein